MDISGHRPNKHGDHGDLYSLYLIVLWLTPYDCLRRQLAAWSAAPGLGPPSEALTLLTSKRMESIIFGSLDWTGGWTKQ